MRVIYERCCGLDIHKRTVVACLIVPGPDGAPEREVRRFGAMTADLRELRWYYEAGLRSLGIVWSRSTVFGHGVPLGRGPVPPDTGLTDAGRNLVRASCGWWTNDDDLQRLAKGVAG